MKDLLITLSPVERKVIPHLKAEQSIENLAEAAQIKEVEAMRAAEFLRQKQVLELERKEEEQYELTEEAKKILDTGFPEQRFLAALDKLKPLQQIQEDADLSREELNASIGVLRKAGAIKMGKEVEKLSELNFDEKLEKLRSKTPEKEFLKRGLLNKKTKITYSLKLTALGKKLIKTDLGEAYDEQVTSQMLKDGSWKEKEFRHYDISIPLPAKNYGRRHFVQEAIKHVKSIWTDMGFEEMEGSMTQTAFWDLDALFVPQDHPAREMQDTFYVKSKGRIDDQELLKKVKETHENGADTQSKGWDYEYSKEEAKRVLLRTHTTVLSAQMIRKIKTDKLELPKKYFSVAKVFRNETLDWKHLAEFHQVEGIVVDRNLTFANLLGLLKQFYKKMGYEQVRFRPAYFPYTEPSVECEVFHPKKKQWVELGGAGIIRPEVVIPLLGEDVPVLAWGLGLERIITDYYEIQDLRHLYDNDLKRLREAPAYKED